MDKVVFLEDIKMSFSYITNKYGHPPFKTNFNEMICEFKKIGVVFDRSDYIAKTLAALKQLGVVSDVLRNEYFVTYAHMYLVLLFIKSKKENKQKEFEF